MRELIEQRDFCGVTYQRSIFIDQDGFILRTTDWIPVAGSSFAGGICGNPYGGIIR